MRTVRRRPRCVLVAALAVTGAGCSDDEKEPGGGGDDGATPEEVLELAKTTLDETSGVQISLKTDEVPSGVTGIKSATGVGAHPAAFEGEFELSVNGLPATAEVIAVDGTTYAKNSLLLPDWTPIDPADYGAPDPATLMDPDGGFSGLHARRSPTSRRATRCAAARTTARSSPSTPAPSRPRRSRP